MSAKFQCRIVTNYDEMKQLSPEWDRLVCRSDFPDLFATSGFARAWWRAYGQERNMRVVVVEDSTGRTRLIAPFQASKETPRSWELIGRPRGDYNNFILESRDVESLKFLFDWLKTQPEWEMLMLRRVPGSSPVLHFFERPYNASLNKLQKLHAWLDFRSWLVYQEARHEHPICNGNIFQQMQDVLQRLHHRRKTKWLMTQGKLNYEVVTDPSEIKEKYLSKFFELHVKEWKTTLAKGSFLRNQIHRDFYNFIVDEMACYKALRFDALTLNDALIAGHIGFHWSGRLYYWLACYDADYRKGSPGRLLLGNIIHSALKMGLKELDMLFGLEKYKEDFQSGIRETGALTIYRSPFVAARLQRRWLPKWYFGRS